MWTYFCYYLGANTWCEYYCLITNRVVPIFKTIWCVFMRFMLHQTVNVKFREYSSPALN